MNTVSLVLNGRTATDIALLPQKQRSSITTLSSRMRSSLPSASPVFAGMTAHKRPAIRKRRSSRDSPGWYNTEGGMTLEDFAQRLNTTTKRFERWQGACAQNIVMALMRPTPVVVLVFHPLSLFICIVLAVWWMMTTNTG